MKNIPTRRAGRACPSHVSKHQKKWRLLLFFFMTTIFQVSAEISYAQKKRISLRLESANIIEALDQLQSLSEFKFFYSQEDLDMERKVSINVDNEVITVILDQLFASSNTTYKIKDKQVILTKTGRSNAPATSDAAKPTRDTRVNGRVLDNKGMGVPGVTVVVKGTTKGTTTNAEGYFSLSVPDEATLIFSSIGFKKQEIPLGSRTELNVLLEEATSDLGEVQVVATGLFDRDKESYTGSATTVHREELLQMSTQNVLDGLATIDPSFVQVQDLSVGSDPNVDPNFQLRGTSSISENLQSQYENDPNQPLFILDGFETTVTKIRDLDINLIESITLLKDATAKAVYGSKGANGVVVVETRRPEGGELRVTYTGAISMEMPDLTSYNLASSEEKLEIERLAGLYSSDNFVTQLDLNEVYNNKLKEVLRGVDTDWLAQPVRTGVGQRNTMYIDGGEKELLYGVELSYNNIQGAMKGSDRKTFTGGVTLTYRKNNFLIRNRLAITDNHSQDSPYGSFSTYARMNPYSRLYDVNGNLIQTYNYNGTLEPNPMYNATINTKLQSKYLDVTNNFYGEWTLTTGLKAVGRLGITSRKITEDNFKPASHTDFINYTDVYRKGSYSQTNASNMIASGNLGLSYSLIIDKHLLYANGQANFNSTSFDRVTLAAEGFPNDKMNHIIFGAQYAEGGKPTGAEGVSHSAGGLVSVNYSYDDRFLFDSNYRLTGSSEYGSNRRWGPFWSVGGGWNIHNEPSLRGNKNINYLKLRGSVGYTGSQGFNTYEALSTVRYYTDQVYQGNIGSYLVSMANPDLRWQSKFDQSIGLDFAFFNSRISGRFDYYVANTEAMLTDVTLPSSTGFNYYRANLGRTQNKGFEANLNVRVYQKPQSRDFINVYSSLSHNKNTLLEISNSLKAFNESQDKTKEQEQNSENYSDITTPSVRYIEGQSINTIWAVPSLGIDPQNGQEIFMKKDGTVTYIWNASDQVAAGNSLPTMTGNMGIRGEIKNIGWNVTFYYRLGGHLYNTTLIDKVENADLTYNVDSRVYTDRWQQEGDIAQFKAISNTDFTRPTTRFVEDYNTMSLSSVNLYYDFRDTKLVKSSVFEQLRFSVNLNDVFVISSVDIERGTSYPYARNVTFSIMATF